MAPAEIQKPNLGLATTQELITELAARAEISLVNNERWPLYRTIKATRSGRVSGTKPRYVNKA